jgi:hypothetical protein
MLLMCPGGLQKLAQIEFGREFAQEMEDVNYRRVWEQLLRKTVAQGRALSPPPPFYVRLEHDATLIRKIHIPRLNA